MKLINTGLARWSRRLDPLWRLAAGLRLLPPSLPAGAAPRQILVVDLHLLGDIVMLEPLLRALRRGQPQARLGLVAGPWAPDVLGDTGLVDEYFCLAAPWVRKGGGAPAWRALLTVLGRVRRQDWDWGIDVRGDLRNIALLTLARARRRIAYDFSGGAALLTDVVPDDGSLRHILEHHRSLAAQLGISISPDEAVPRLPLPVTPPAPGLPRPLAGLHFGASQPLRRLPLDEAIALTLHLAARPDLHLVLFEAPDTQDIVRQVVERLPAAVAGRVLRWHGSLRELMALLGQLDAFYGMDSGPAHLAAALGVETTVFFGPNLPAAVRPWGRQVRVIEQAGLYCRPCDQVHCINGQRQACLRGVVARLHAAPG